MAQRTSRSRGPKRGKREGFKKDDSKRDDSKREDFKKGKDAASRPRSENFKKDRNSGPKSAPGQRPTREEFKKDREPSVDRKSVV